jgi:hypothetical protein
MKTERRHELQKNQLADTLGSEIDYLRPYYKTIVGVLIAVVAVGATIAILSSNRQAKNIAAWGSFYDVVAESNAEKIPKKMEGLVNTFPGTPAALWAELAAGGLELQTGSQKMFSDRKAAEESLSKAKRHFQTVLEQGKSQPMLRRRAQFGLAQTFEALNEPDEALPLYEQLAKDDSEDAFGKAATERVAQVKRLSDNGWYTWFAKHEPALPAEDPLEGRDPLHNLPSRNNLNKGLNAPGIIGSELMETEPSNPLEPGIELDSPKKKAPRDKTDDAFPVKPDATGEPADEKKTDEPPASETPSDEKKADAPATTPEPPADAPSEKKDDAPADVEPPQ